MNHEAWTSGQCWFSAAKHQILLTVITCIFTKICLIRFRVISLQVNKAQEVYLVLQESQGPKDHQVSNRKSYVYMLDNAISTLSLFLWAQTREQLVNGIV